MYIGFGGTPHASWAAADAAAGGPRQDHVMVVGYAST